jgi:hypothetical protein
MNKTLGNIEPCPTCSEKLICVEVPASGNFAARLSWQNLIEATGKGSGAAHFNKKEGAKYVCPNGGLQGETVAASKRIVDEEIESAIPAVAPNAEITTSMQVVLQALSLADNQTTVLYPKLSKTAYRFGKIRARIADQILSVYNARNQSVTTIVTK